MKKIDVVNDVTSLDQDFFNTLQSNVEEVFNGEEAMGSIVVDDVECKNKFDINTMVELKGLFRYVENGEIQSNPDYDGIKIPVKPNTGYSFSTDAEKWSNLCFFDNSFNFIGSDNFNEGNYIITPNNCYYITLAIMKGYTWCQLEEGNTITPPSPFKKFGYNSQESMGKIVVDDIECKNLIYGFRAGYGFNTTTSQYELATMFSTTEPIEVELGETYIFSHAVGHIGGGVHCLDSNGIFIETLNQDTLLSPFTITNPNCKKVVIVAWDPNNNAIANETWMQLEKGTVATPFTPYKEFSNKHIYSTEEHIVGTWIDGRDVYEKIVELNTDFVNLFILNANDVFPNYDINTLSFVDVQGKRSTLEQWVKPKEILNNGPAGEVSFNGFGWNGEDFHISKLRIIARYAKNTQPAMMSLRPDTTEEGELDG